MNDQPAAQRHEWMGDVRGGHVPEVAAILAMAGGQDYALALMAGILSTLPVAVGIYDASDPAEAARRLHEALVTRLKVAHR